MISIGFCCMHATFNKSRSELFHSEILPNWARENVLPSMSLSHTPGTLWATAKRAWLMSSEEPGCTHWMVLQDDFVLCKNFMQHATEFVSRHPSEACCLFQPATIHPQDCEQQMARGAEFATSDTLWGGSIVLPSAIVKNVMDIASSFNLFQNEDDVRISSALNVLGIPAWVCSPSLIRHVGALHESLSGHTKNDAETVRYRLGYTFRDNPET